MKSEILGQTEHNPTIYVKFKAFQVIILDIFTLLRNRAPLLGETSILRQYCVLKIDIKL